MAIVLVEAKTAGNDSLAYQVVTVAEALDDRAALQFIDNLGVAGQVVGIDKIVGSHAVDSLGDSISIAIVNKTSAE